MAGQEKSLLPGLLYIWISLSLFSFDLRPFLVCLFLSFFLLCGFSSLLASSSPLMVY